MNLAATASNGSKSEHEQGRRCRVQRGVDSRHEAEIGVDAAPLPDQQEPAEKPNRGGRHDGIEDPETSLALVAHGSSLGSSTEGGQRFVDRVEDRRDFVERIVPVGSKPHQAVGRVANDPSVTKACCKLAESNVGRHGHTE